MSANKKGSKSKNIALSGKVVSKKFGEGSKSEHEALYLETDQGSYVLRQPGANPFQDNPFISLEGKEVIATGTIDNYIFFATRVDEKKEKSSKEQRIRNKEEGERDNNQ
jgi:hypothetical protein